MKFDVIEIMDEPNNNFFNVNIFDCDFDGDLDILLGRMDDGNIYKNIGNNKNNVTCLAFAKGLDKKIIQISSNIIVLRGFSKLSPKYRSVSKQIKGGTYKIDSKIDCQAKVKLEISRPYLVYS
jgi:hypothetical protein